MKTTSLKEICTVFGDGDWIESKDQSDSGIRLIQTGNVGVGVFKDRIEKARWISEETFKKLRCTEICEGDVLVSRLPDPVGRACLLPALEHKAITAVDCSIVRFDKEIMDPRFFVYYSQSSEYASAVEPLISGSTRQRISREKLGTIQIPLVSMEKQREIVEKLDKAFTEIDSLEKKLQLKEEKTNQLLQSMFNAALNNDKSNKKVVTLDQISENLDSQRIPITREVRTVGKYPYYGASGIIDYVEDYIFEGDALLVSEDGANLLARSTPIAFSVTGKYWVNNHAHVLRFTDQYLQEYVKYFLENTNLDKYITGAAQPKLTQRALNSIPIKIPVNKIDTKLVSETLSSLKELTFLISENNSRRKRLTDELKSAFLTKYIGQKVA
jgi:type I restriction enzyme S subunit